MHYNIDEPWGHYTKGSKLVTKGQKLHNPTHIRHLEQLNSQRKKAVYWLPGVERMEEWGVVF